MPNCEYEAEYNDLEDMERFKSWICAEKTDGLSPFCTFHDRTKMHWNSEITARFRMIVQDSITRDTTLFCIGYHFPVNFSIKLLLPLDPVRPELNLSPRENIGNVTRDTRRRVCPVPIYFCEADFGGQVVFSHCTFKNTVNLSGAMFRRQVLIRDTVFEGKFYPRNTKFHDNVNFRFTKFLNADFHDTLFVDKANFHESEFMGKTRFLDTRFEGKANFVKTKFHGETFFIGTLFKEAFFSPDVIFERETKFNHVSFENGEKNLFAVNDLSNVSFQNTDITRVIFEDNVQWGPYKNSFKIFDERVLEESLYSQRESPVRLKDVITAYRNLRKNYDFRLRYELADEFFKREMELKRLYKDRLGKSGYVVHRNNWFGRNFSLTGLYRHITRYGQDFVRPMLLAAFIVCIPIAYELQRLWSSGARMDIDVILNVTTKNISNIFKIDNQDVVGFLIGAITVPILIGLVVAALKRPFERKFRV